jgi:hypothetical protein
LPLPFALLAIGSAARSIDRPTRGTGVDWDCAPFRFQEADAMLRLYFLTPDVRSAHRLTDSLLLARVSDGSMHVLARRGTELGPLHEASFLQKTDIRHGAAIGLCLGGILGAAMGTLWVLFPPAGLPAQLVTVLLSAVGGGLFGSWVSSMVALAVPNSDLKPFAPALERGSVLVMTDVPARRADEIREMVRNRHPDCEIRGQDPLVPAFP